MTRDSTITNATNNGFHWQSPNWTNIVVMPLCTWAGSALAAQAGFELAKDVGTTSGGIVVIAAVYALSLCIFPLIAQGFVDAQKASAEARHRAASIGAQENFERLMRGSEQEDNKLKTLVAASAQLEAFERCLTKLNEVKQELILKTSTLDKLLKKFEESNGKIQNLKKSTSSAKQSDGWKNQWAAQVQTDNELYLQKNSAQIQIAELSGATTQLLGELQTILGSLNLEQWVSDSICREFRTTTSSTNGSRWPSHSMPNASANDPSSSSSPAESDLDIAGPENGYKRALQEARDKLNEIKTRAETQLSEEGRRNLDSLQEAPPKLGWLWSLAAPGTALLSILIFGRMRSIFESSIKLLGAGFSVSSRIGLMAYLGAATITIVYVMGSSLMNSGRGSWPNAVRNPGEAGQ